MLIGQPLNVVLFASVDELVIFRFLMVDKLVSPLNISEIVVTPDKSLSELNSTEVNKVQLANKLSAFFTTLPIVNSAVLRFAQPSKYPLRLLPVYLNLSIFFRVVLFLNEVF